MVIILRYVVAVLRCIRLFCFLLVLFSSQIVNLNRFITNKKLEEPKLSKMHNDI